MGKYEDVSLSVYKIQFTKKNYGMSRKKALSENRAVRHTAQTLFRFFGRADL